MTLAAARIREMLPHACIDEDLGQLQTLGRLPWPIELEILFIAIRVDRSVMHQLRWVAGTSFVL